jgi:hypothetical protein
MDEHSREIFQRAYAALERLDDFEPKYQHVPDDDLPPRRTAPEVIYKTYQPAMRGENDPALQQRAEMDPETAALWNRWVDAKLEAAVAGVAQGTGQMVRDLQKQITDLRTEMDKLRSELAVSKSENVLKLRGSVG